MDLPFDGGQLVLVPVAQGLAAFHLAARLGHEVGVALLDRVVQCDDGGLEFVVRFAYLPAQQTESLGGVAAREAGPSDRRVQRLRLAGEPVEAARLCLVPALLCGAHPVAQGQPFGRGLRFEPARGLAEPLVEAGRRGLAGVPVGRVEDDLVAVAGKERAQRGAAVVHETLRVERDLLLPVGAGQPHGDRLPGLFGDESAVERDGDDGRVRESGHDVRHVVRLAEFLVADLEAGVLERVREVPAADLDADVVTLANIKALATGDPDIQRRMTLENEINQLKLLRVSWAQQKADTRRDIGQQLQPRVELLRQSIREKTDDKPLASKALSIHQTARMNGRWEGMTINGQPVGDRQTACRLLHQAAHQAHDGDTIAEYDGLPVIARRAAVTGRITLAVKAVHEHESGTEMPGPYLTGPSSIVSQLDRIIKNMATDPGKLTDRLADAERELAAARETLAEPFAHGGRIPDKNRPNSNG